MAMTPERRALATLRKHLGPVRPWWTLFRDYFVGQAWTLIYAIRNRFCRRSALGTANVAVSLTSHGDRLETVHLTIESIVRGRFRPKELILWLGQNDCQGSLPPGLQRLCKRGLEVRSCEDVGPHTKYYPYVLGQTTYEFPLVTADDDLFYSATWLRNLVLAYQEDPAVIHAYRCQKMLLFDGKFAPYVTWLALAKTDSPQLDNLIIGSCGAIYPPSFLSIVASHGIGFAKCTPNNDDIWLTYLALQGDVPVRQLRPKAGRFTVRPKTQRLALYKTVNKNLDEQLARTFGADAMERLASRAAPH